MIKVTEMLIRRVSKSHTDPERDAKLTKRGDVICVCPYPWEWSSVELNNTDWIIVQSDLPLEEANLLLEQENDDPRINVLSKRRAKYFDLDGAVLEIAKKYPGEFKKIKPPYDIPLELEKEDIAKFIKINKTDNPFII